MALSSCAMPAPAAPAMTSDTGSHALAAALTLFAELAGCSGEEAEQVAARALAASAAAPSPRARHLRAWQAVLQMPGLVSGPMPALGQAFAPLQALPAGQRLLFLLAQLAACNQSELAALLRISPAQCRQALAQVQMHLGEKQGALADALQMRQRGFSAQRRARIHRLMTAHDGEEPARMATRRPAPRRALTGVALLTLLAFVVVGWLPGRHNGDAQTEGQIRSRALPDTDAAASRYPVQATLQLHPDRALLSLPAEEAALAADTAFLAWYEAERNGQIRPWLPIPDEPPLEAAAEALPAPLEMDID